MTKPIVTVGVPTGDYFTIVRPTAMSITKMIAYTLNNKICEKVYFESASSVKTEHNRNTLVGAMQDDSEFLLQIDADMVFPENTLERMIQSYENILKKEQKPFVLSGLGFMGTPPYFPAMFHAVEKIGEGFRKVDGSLGSEIDGWVPVTDIPQEPFEVDAVGSFGMMVPYEVFNKFKGYGGWFNHHIDMDPAVEGKFLEIRHDLAFSMRVKESGHKIFVDPSIDFGHIRPQPINLDVWNFHKKRMGLQNPELLQDFHLQQFRARHLRTAFGWQLRSAETDGLSPEEKRQNPVDRS